MSNINKVIVVFEDGTTKESEKFFGAFHFDDGKEHIVSEGLGLNEVFFSMHKMEYLVNRRLENHMKEAE